MCAAPVMCLMWKMKHDPPPSIVWKQERILHQPRLKPVSVIWMLIGALALAGLSAIFHGALTFGRAAVTVEWETASELDTAGFNLLRSENPDGPFERINDSIILSTGDSLSGGSYRYEDATAAAGKTYYYLLEEIGSDGSSNRHGPIAVSTGNTAKLELLTGGLLLTGAGGYAFIRWRDATRKPPAEA